jgi:hypothetical protein
MPQPRRRFHDVDSGLGLTYVCGVPSPQEPAMSDRAVATAAAQAAFYSAPINPRVTIRCPSGAAIDVAVAQRQQTPLHTARAHDVSHVEPCRVFHYVDGWLGVVVAPRRQGRGGS